MSLCVSFIGRPGRYDKFDDFFYYCNAELLKKSKNMLMTKNETGAVGKASEWLWWIIDFNQIDETMKKLMFDEWKGCGTTAQGK